MARGKILRDYIAKIRGILGRDLVVLDVGGRADYWENVGLDNIAAIRIQNHRLGELEQYKSHLSNIFTYEQGDARDLSSFDDKSIDLVHSNSVIEHVGIWRDQKAMAREVHRIGKAGWIQTPNWAFPIEPHFKMPFVHWLGAPLRRQLISLKREHRDWHLDNLRDYVDEINILSYAEFRTLFPDDDIFEEKFFGLTKSMTARWMPSSH